MKALIVMGVFAALLTVCSMIDGVIFAITPTLTFYFSIGASLLPGPVFLLLLAKAPILYGEEAFLNYQEEKSRKSLLHLCMP